MKNVEQHSGEKNEERITQKMNNNCLEDWLFGDN